MAKKIKNYVDDEFIFSLIFFSFLILFLVLINFIYLFRDCPELFNIINLSKITINQYVSKLIINNLLGLLMFIYFSYEARCIIFESTNKRIKLFNFILYISSFLTVFLLLILQIRVLHL